VFSGTLNPTQSITLLFAAHAHTIATCFAVVSSIPSLSLNSLLGTLVFYLNITHPTILIWMCNVKVSCYLEFNVPLQHKYGYIRDERLGMESYPYPVKEG